MLYVYLIVALASLFALAGPNLVGLLSFMRINSKYPYVPEDTKPETIGSKKKTASAGLQSHQTDEHFPTAPAPTPVEKPAVIRTSQPVKEAPYSLIPTLSLDSIVVAPTAVHPLNANTSPELKSALQALPTDTSSSLDAQLPQSADPVPFVATTHSPLDNLQVPAVFRRRPPKQRLSNPLTIRR